MFKGFSGRQIKIIACVSMLFSHVGLVFWPQEIWWQVPGRLAMPLFAYMLASGARHSRNTRHYLLRLSLFALAVQYPYSIFLSTGRLNICFTLAVGLAALLLWQSEWPLFARAVAVMALGMVAEYTNMEYGLYGIATIILAQLCYDDWRKLTLCWGILNLPELLGLAQGLSAGVTNPPVQGFCLLALPFLRYYNGQRGGGSRWEFYAFYLGHMALLYGLRRWLWGF